eukprot:Opistho-1_new@85545
MEGHFKAEPAARSATPSDAPKYAPSAADPSHHPGAFHAVSYDMSRAVPYTYGGAPAQCTCGCAGDGSYGAYPAHPQYWAQPTAYRPYGGDDGHMHPSAYPYFCAPYPVHMEYAWAPVPQHGYPYVEVPMVAPARGGRAGKSRAVSATKPHLRRTHVKKAAVKKAPSEASSRASPLDQQLSSPPHSPSSLSSSAADSELRVPQQGKTSKRSKRTSGEHSEASSKSGSPDLAPETKGEQSAADLAEFCLNLSATRCHLPRMAL